jgi:hypothetical protein
MPTKTLEVGKVNGRRAFVTVEVKNRDKGKGLAISGDVAGVSCGQIIEEIAQVSEFAPGWDAERLGRLLTIWRRHHLNDMRPGCEHQTGPAWDASQSIEKEELSIDWEVWRTIERAAEADITAYTGRPDIGPREAMSPEPSLLNPADRRRFERFSASYGLLSLLEKAGIRPFAWTAVDARTRAALERQFSFVPAAKIKEYHAARVREMGRSMPRPSETRPPLLKRVQTQRTGWVRPDEHPAGILMKPCEVCGYRYGAEWRFHPLPPDVVAFVEELVTGADAGNPYDIQAQDFLDRFCLTITVAAGPSQCPDWSTRRGLGACAHDHGLHYTIRIARDRGHVLAFDFWGSQKDAEEGKEPTPYDVLSCLAADIGMPDDPDEIAGEMGDMKPSQALKAAEWFRKLRAFFTREECEALADIR